MCEPFKWDDIRIFLAVVESGSYGKAADSLGLTQPTVSRRIAQLEARVEKTLFNRKSSGAILTEAGKDLLKLAVRMADSASAIENQSDKAASGRVKIRIPDVLATCVVMPAMPEFFANNPELTLEIDCGIVNTEDTSPHIILQFLDPADAADMVRIPMCWVHYTYFANPDYLAKHGTPSTLPEIISHRIIGHASYYAHRRKWAHKSDAIDQIAQDEKMVECDAGALNLYAIKYGVGIGVLPTAVFDTEPDLQPLPVDFVPASLALNMYYESGADSSFNIHICKEWLLSLFSGERVRWFRKDFDNPYDAWVKRQIG